jgi:hypothetical protein
MLVTSQSRIAHEIVPPLAARPRELQHCKDQHSLLTHTMSPGFVWIDDLNRKMRGGV